MLMTMKKFKRKSSRLLKFEKEIFGEDEVRAIDGIVLNITMADITGGTKYHRGFSHLFPKGQFHWTNAHWSPSACASSHSLTFVSENTNFIRHYRCRKNVVDDIFPSVENVFVCFSMTRSDFLYHNLTFSNIISIK